MLDRLFRWVLVLGVCGLGACSAPPASHGSPAEARALVEKVTATRVSGLPQGGDWRRLRPLLSSDFAAVVAGAQVAQAAQRRAHPDEKPDWIEGDFFSSLFEGPQTWQVGQPHIQAWRATVPVVCSYCDGSNVVRWTDTFHLIEDEGRWRLDDVSFGGTWDFANKGSLKEALRRRQGR